MSARNDEHFDALRSLVWAPPVHDLYWAELVEQAARLIAELIVSSPDAEAIVGTWMDENAASAAAGLRALRMVDDSVIPEAARFMALHQVAEIVDRARTIADPRAG